MKNLIFLSLLSMTVTAGAASNGRPFNCVSGSGNHDLLSISACVNNQGTQLMPCKGQSSRHLGTAYLNLEMVQYKSGRTISAPVIETILIPADLVTVSINSGTFEIKMQNADIGALDIRMPSDPRSANGKENGRYFYAHVKGIQANLESVVCQYRKKTHSLIKLKW